MYVYFTCSLNSFGNKSLKDADAGLLGAFQKPLQTSDLGFLYIWADTLHKNISSLTAYACLFFIGNTNYIYCMLLW